MYRCGRGAIVPGRVIYSVAAKDEMAESAVL